MIVLCDDYSHSSVSLLLLFFWIRPRPVFLEFGVTTPFFPEAKWFKEMPFYPSMLMYSNLKRNNQANQQEVRNIHIAGLNKRTNEKIIYTNDATTDELRRYNDIMENASKPKSHVKRMVEYFNANSIPPHPRKNMTQTRRTLGGYFRAESI